MTRESDPAMLDDQIVGTSLEIALETIRVSNFILWLGMHHCILPSQVSPALGFSFVSRESFYASRVLLDYWEIFESIRSKPWPFYPGETPYCELKLRNS